MDIENSQAEEMGNEDILAMLHKKGIIKNGTGIAACLQIDI